MCMSKGSMYVFNGSIHDSNGSVVTAIAIHYYSPWNLQGHKGRGVSIHMYSILIVVKCRLCDPYG